MSLFSFRLSIFPDSPLVVYFLIARNSTVCALLRIPIQLLSEKFVSLYSTLSSEYASKFISFLFIRTVIRDR